MRLSELFEKSAVHSTVLSKFTPLQIAAMEGGHSLDSLLEGKVTAAQVAAAKNRYDSFGLRIENARKKVGYTRGTGVIGELQQKRGAAYAKYMELKRQYDAQQSAEE